MWPLRKKSTAPNLERATEHELIADRVAVRRASRRKAHEDQGARLMPQLVRGHEGNSQPWSPTCDSYGALSSP
jgi:hypothetical protein